MADAPLFDEPTILRQSAALRLMVRALVRNDAAADDVIQETWLMVLRRHPAGFELGGWLRGIARNVARTVRRTDARRARREVGSATRGTAPSAADDAAKVETLRELLGLVSSLGDPARQAVILRYLDGLMPREIAERLGIPVATVKARIQTGLRALRDALDAKHGGDRSAWHTAFAGLVPEMAAAGTVATTGAVLSSILTGAIAMKTTLGVLGVIVIFAFVIWMAPTRTEERGQLAAPLRAPADVEIAHEPAGGGDPARRITPRTFDSAAEQAASAPTTSGGVRVLVVTRETGAPVPGARVRMWETNPLPDPARRDLGLLRWDTFAALPGGDAVERTTDATGFATFPSPPGTAVSSQKPRSCGGSATSSPPTAPASCASRSRRTSAWPFGLLTMAEHRSPESP